MVCRNGAKAKWAAAERRRWVYNFLRRPQTWPAILYHVAVIGLILVALFCFALTTVPSVTGGTHRALVILDDSIAALAGAEFCALVWASAGWPKYQGLRGLRHFLSSKSTLFDVVILVAAMALTFHHHGNIQLWPSFQSGWAFALRFGQWSQILRLGYRFKPWRIMASVIWQQRYQFLITFYMCFVWLIFVTMVMYAAEQAHHGGATQFTSLPKTFWWSVVSLFTIGYGDMTPATNTGKILASVFFFLFIFKFALPAGVLSTGLALKIQDQHRLKHISQRRMAAARLIQNAWRYYHQQHTGPAVFHRRRSRFQSNDSGAVMSGGAEISPETQCIRFIEAVRFVRARRQFRRALRPYDFADVMEQYEMGHDEIATQLGRLDARVDRAETALVQSQRTLEAILRRLEDRGRHFMGPESEPPTHW